MSAVGPVGRLVAENVRRLREVRGLSLRQLAARIAEEGGSLSADAINKIENGRLQSTEPVQVRRVNVDDLVALAAALGAPPATLLQQAACGLCLGAPPAGFTCNVCAAGVEQAETAAPPQRRRNAVTDERLRAIAAAYRGARERGHAPTAAVAEQFHASHSTAARWVGMARKRGLLGATTPGRGGEL